MKTKLRLLLVTAVIGGAGVVAALTAANAGAACTGTTCPAGAPGVVAASPYNITSHGATLSGEVYTNGSTTTCFFRYGQTTAYGSQTAPSHTVFVAKGNPARSVSFAVTGLAATNAYHYQLVCHNTHGYTYGSDVAFTTADTGPSTIALSGHTGFVSSSGVGGVFIGCYGDRTCTGTSLTITRGSSVLASRSSYSIAPNTGGIVHVRLTSGAFNTLKSRHFYNVSVASTTTDGRALVGGDTGLVLTLHIFS